MRWPPAWRDPSALALLNRTPFNSLLFDKPAGFAPVIAKARQNGLGVSEGAAVPAGVTLIQGEWPGVRLSKTGGDRAEAGPTGVPWVDSNGWKIRLAGAMNPGGVNWVEAPPKASRVSAAGYVTAVADAAAPGGRWIVSLDNQLAAALAGGDPGALETWKRISGAAAFFNARKGWNAYVPEAVLGIVSSFSGENEFMGHELLNLVARTNQQYRIVPKDKATSSSLQGLKAVLYADADPPAADLRKLILAFVETGGMLITGLKWGPPPGTPGSAEHPRYAMQVLGKGRIAVARSALDDPYLVANDSAVLISHRYELLRFWNGGAVGSYLTAAQDGRRGVAHLLFYSQRAVDTPTVQVAGPYRTARLWTLDQPAPRPVEAQVRKNALELHLPAISQYAAVELEV